MGKAGCWLISWGIESANEQILKRARKGYKKEQAFKALQWAHAAGIKNWGYFIIGLPGETEETIQETIAYAKELPLDIALFHIAAPYPGTPFFYEVVENNWFRPGTNWEEVDMDKSTVLDYPGLPAERLEYWQKRATHEWSLPPRPDADLRQGPEHLGRLQERRQRRMADPGVHSRDLIQPIDTTESAAASGRRSQANTTRAAVTDRRFVLFWLAALAFYAATLLSFWAAYDRSAAFGRLAGLTAGLVAVGVIAFLARRSRYALIAWGGMACLALAALIGGYFLLTYDWQAAGAGKVAIIYRLGLWLQAGRPSIPLPFTEDINGNVAGGAMILLLPLGLGGAGWLIRNCPWPRAIKAVVGVIVAIVALFVLAAVMLTLSRGSWLAVAAATAAAIYMAWRGRLKEDHLWLDVIAFGAFTAALIGIFAVAVRWPGSSAGVGGLEALLGAATGVGGSGASRVSLWRDMLPLVADYPLTGGGLGSTMMVFSSYVLMLHVGFIGHAHNLFLQIAVEQGLPAMAAFGVMTGTAAWGVLRSAGRPGRRQRFPAPAAMAAIVAMLIHGMVDAGPWTSKLAPVVFLPLGFAIATWAARCRKVYAYRGTPRAWHGLPARWRWRRRSSSPCCRPPDRWSNPTWGR